MTAEDPMTCVAIGTGKLFTVVVVKKEKTIESEKDNRETVINHLLDESFSLSFLESFDFILYYISP